MWLEVMEYNFKDQGLHILCHQYETKLDHWHTVPADLWVKYHTTFSRELVACIILKTSMEPKASFILSY